ncbi:MAG TPA: hypothetical protein VKA21_01865 [Candidatus Binatia bacterium]|nr:hypothetical protein [Candidatus Binatia bacterium]
MTTSTGGASTSSTDPRPAASSGRPVGIAVALAFSLALVEALCWTLGTLVVIPRAPFVFHRPPERDTIGAAAFADYVATRDPDLGWPAASEATRSRPDPLFPEPGTEWVSAYGDSFTQGHGVGDDATWCHVLSRKIGARVANFGVGGYGTDQAFLRFRKNGADRARVTILGIYPDDLKRNVNQQRYLLMPIAASRFGLKPRFVLDGEALKLEPLPTLSHAEYLDSFAHPERYFPAEFFLPGTRDTQPAWSFPFSVSIVRAVLSPQVNHWLHTRPGWLDFASVGHPSRALEITTAIVRAFEALAAERGKRVLVLVFPPESSFEAYRRDGVVPTGVLDDRLAKAGTDVLDLTVGLDEYLAGRPFIDLYLRPRSSHYNAEAHRAIADLVRHRMLERGLLPPAR